jgi:hypothetical protein
MAGAAWSGVFRDPTGGVPLPEEIT